MKAIAIGRNGGPDVLEVSEQPVPEPAQGEALVRLEASGVNFIDIYYRTGVYKAPRFPFILGNEGAGTVERVGPGVTRVKPGDRVAWAMTVGGGYAEQAVVPESRLVPVPPEIELRDAAALMLQGMTAHYLVNSTYPLKAGEVALVHAGAGGVGLLLTQLAKAKGATVITTVSTAEKERLSREAGADHVVRYTETDFAEEVRRITGGAGAHVIYDSVGKTTFERGLDALRPRGFMVLFGASSGAPAPLELQQLVAKGSLFVTRPSLAHYTLTPEETQWRAGEVFGAVRSGALKLRIERDYPLADARRAHEDLEGRKTTGKLLLLP